MATPPITPPTAQPGRAPCAEVSARQAMHWRLGQHGLLTRRPAAELVDVASRLGGVHAQVLTSAVLGLWARTQGLTRDHVDTALWEHRTLVKSWTMRGTLHVMPAAELGTWVAALAMYRDGYSHYKMGDEQSTDIAELTGQALHGQLLTRAELGSRVAELAGSVELREHFSGGWGNQLKPAAFRGLLCFAPGVGPRVRFTNPHTWLPNGVAVVDPEAARHDVTRRYFHAYGPARASDFSAWWGVTQGTARTMIDDLGDEIRTVLVDGEPRLMLADDVPDLLDIEPRNVAHLLPGFDQWVVSASRNPLVIDTDKRRAVFNQQGWIAPIVTVNGKVAGTWTSRTSAARLVVEVSAFRPLPRWARTHVERHARRLATYHRRSLALQWL